MGNSELLMVMVNISLKETPQRRMSDAGEYPLEEAEKDEETEVEEECNQYDRELESMQQELKEDDMLVQRKAQQEGEQEEKRRKEWRRKEWRRKGRREKRKERKEKWRRKRGRSSRGGRGGGRSRGRGRREELRRKGRREE